ncbi:helix-turn-helix domain-containing protein [Streptomyces sp. NPDC101118]|uniref:helix-turn-helix domain-containing protein n=1 Tax=Streptomyces sp. NPDC101118 TaxID=3366109 RepID=UPI0037F7057F
MADEKKNPLGPIGSHVQVAVEHLRVARGLTKRELSEKVGELGRSIPPLGISRIEAGMRRVDADDLVALALALNVSPLVLLLPQPEVGDTYVRLTSKLVTRLSAAWSWVKGERAMSPDMDGQPDQEQQEQYELLSQSKRDRYVRRRPAGRAAELVLADVGRAVEISQFTMSSHPEEFANRMAAARASQDRLNIELDRMEAEYAELVRGLEQLRAERRDAGREESHGQGLD